jgi:hypothetical protein
MSRPRQGRLLLAGAAALTAWDTACAAPADPAPPPLVSAGPIVATPRLFNEDDLLLFAVSSAGLQLSDGFEA